MPERAEIERELEATLGQWTPGGRSADWQGAELVVRPSLLAALDVPFKAALTLVVLFAPFGFAGVATADDPLAALPFFGLLQLFQVAPAVLFAFAPAVRIAFTRYVIEPDGIRVVTQVLARNESRIPWNKVTAVRQRVTFTDRLLRLERLDIIAYGERGTTVHLVGLRNAKGLRDATARLMRHHATVAGLFRND